jgi:hypothetical protein
MNLQNDMYEVKTSMEKMVESHARQIQAFDSFMATGGAGRLPAGISRGHAVLIDATGREHVMLLEQCRYFDVRQHSTHMCVRDTQQMISAT